MSHDSFDDAALARLDSGSSSQQKDNAISINSLTANDFREYDRGKRAEPVILHGFGVTGDFPGAIEEKPFGVMKPGVIQVPNIEFGVGDKPFKYPLPQEVSAAGGETALGELTQRITNKAVAKVQESMSPAEKEALNKDTEKYAEEMRKYQDKVNESSIQLFYRSRSEQWPQPPHKPQSLVNYEQAIDKEIERMVKGLNA